MHLLVCGLRLPPAWGLAHDCEANKLVPPAAGRAMSLHNHASCGQGAVLGCSGTVGCRGKDWGTVGKCWSIVLAAMGECGMQWGNIGVRWENWGTAGCIMVAVNYWGVMGVLV